MEDTANLDALSLQVITLLQNDGRISIREMADRLGVAPATVRARYNQLLDDGTIQIVAVPDPRKLGLDFHALVSARLQPGRLDEAVAVLEAKAEVTWIGLTLGEHGVVFEVVARDAQAFGAYKDQLLAALPGYLGSDVAVIWDVRKFRYAMPAHDASGQWRKRQPAPARPAAPEPLRVRSRPAAHRSAKTAKRSRRALLAQD